MVCRSLKDMHVRVFRVYLLVSGLGLVFHQPCLFLCDYGGGVFSVARLALQAGGVPIVHRTPVQSVR